MEPSPRPQTVLQPIKEKSPRPPRSIRRRVDSLLRRSIRSRLVSRERQPATREQSWSEACTWARSDKAKYGRRRRATFSRRYLGDPETDGIADRDSGAEVRPKTRQRQIGWADFSKNMVLQHDGRKDRVRMFLRGQKAARICTASWQRR